jgi:hypothetical protein
MQLLPITWAELHSPLFLGGTNLGQKLDPAKKTGLKIARNVDERIIYVVYNGCCAEIPEAAFQNWNPDGKRKDEVLAAVNAAVPDKIKAAPSPSHTPGRPIEAQVSTPTSHVFAGEKKK